jgi:Arc/MetJ-type ribon-helix-helix transcriptional regulator
MAQSELNTSVVLRREQLDYLDAKVQRVKEQTGIYISRGEAIRLAIDQMMEREPIRADSPAQEPVESVAS